MNQFIKGFKSVFLAFNNSNFQYDWGQAVAEILIAIITTAIILLGIYAITNALYNILDKK